MPVDREYVYMGKYAHLSVRYHQIKYTLMVIAGWIPSDPDGKEDPRRTAEKWLIEHGYDISRQPSFFEEL